MLGFKPWAMLEVGWLPMQRLQVSSGSIPLYVVRCENSESFFLTAAVLLSHAVDCRWNLLASWACGTLKLCLNLCVWGRGWCQQAAVHGSKGRVPKGCWGIILQSKLQWAGRQSLAKCVAHAVAVLQRGWSG